MAGDSQKTVAMPATAPEIIAVAAYTTRNRWDGGSGCCQVAFSLGDLLTFSSSGPTADPNATGQKPEIAAPGAMIASALSSQADMDPVFILSDGKHSLQAGTSMAAPFVSGTIALMLSANPDFTNDDIKRYIVGSAYVDGAVGSAPNNRWGFGKLDVLAALEMAVNGGASGSFASDASPAEPEGAGASSSGGSGCSMSGMSDGSASGAMLSAAMLAIAAAAMAARRRLAVG